MPISFQHSKDRLLGRLLDFLWHQWSTLGVAGQRSGVDDRIVDPEALLLITTRFGRYDSRLLDEVIDWLSSNGKRINLQRLRRLHDEWPVADLRVLAAISKGLATQSTMKKWLTLSDVLPEVGEPELLFIRFDGSAMPVLGEPDPNFLRHGLLRDPVERRRMSQAPDPGRAGNLLCCLRALFGVNSRAEIIGWLLSHESGHPAAIARDTGYFSKSIQHTLNEMADSGHVRSHRDGREKHFWLKPGDWDFLITWSQPLGFPRWFDWMPVFSAVTTFIDAIGVSGLDHESEQIQSIQIRQALDSAMPALTRAGLAVGLAATREQTGARMIDAIQQDLEKLEAMLTPSTSYNT
jgi:hypothetical protein